MLQAGGPVPFLMPSRMQHLCREGGHVPSRERESLWPRRGHRSLEASPDGVSEADLQRQALPLSHQAALASQIRCSNVR